MVRLQGQVFDHQPGILRSKPYQNPRPLLICAGTSPKGREFAARYCDINFAILEDLQKGAAWVKAIKKLAWEENKREIGTFTYCYAIVRDTEREAREYYNYYVREKGDWEAANNICDIFGIQSESATKEYLDQFRENFIAGWGGYPLVGTADQVTDKLAEISGTGVDGRWYRSSTIMRNSRTGTRR